MNGSVRPARFPDDRDAVLALWREYVATTATSLDYQNNETEFADLPGKYAPPAGRLLLAEWAGAPVGCVALRRVSAAICEMKRLYLRPQGRGHGLATCLVGQLIVEAREADYAEMRLDVLAEFDRAQALYRRFGFAPADPVTYNPVPGAAFLGLRL